MVNIKSAIINIIFTFVILGILIFICLESSLLFHKKLKSKTSLKFCSENYKTAYEDERSDILYHLIANSPESKLYEKNPQKRIANLPTEIPEYKESIDNLIHEIVQNPLSKGYYAQIGIFSSKESAQEVIKILSLKGILNESFTSYIEKKEIGKNKEVYFLEIGVFPQKHDALLFCEGLGRINVACIVIE